MDRHSCNSWEQSQITNALPDAIITPFHTTYTGRMIEQAQLGDSGRQGFIK